MNRKTATLLLGSALTGLSRPAFAQTATPLKIITAHDDDATPVVYAQQNGLFQSNGIDVTITGSTSGSAATVGVVGGAADIGKANLLSLIIAHAKSVPLVIVGPAAYWSLPMRITSLVVAKDGPLRTGADFNGKTIAVPGLYDLAWLEAKLWVDKNGGNSTTVKFVEVPQASVAAGIDAGRIDAGVLIEPALSASAATNKYRALGNLDAGIAPRYLFSGWMASTDYVARNAQVVAKFAHILHQASVYCNDHRPQTVDILAKFAGIDPQVIASMGRSVYPTSLDPKDIQPLVDATAQYKIIPASFDAKDMINSVAIQAYRS